MNEDIVRAGAIGGSAQAEFASLLATIWRRRWWLATCVLAFVGVSVAAALVLPRVYKASTVLVMASPTEGLGSGLASALGSLGGMASLAGINLDSGNERAEEVMAVLKSREFIEKFIREKNLSAVLYPGDWDAQTGTWKAGTRPHTLAEAYKYFTAAIMTVKRAKGGGLITLDIEWTDGAEAAAWANELVERLNAEMRKRALEQADKSMGFLEQELKRTTLVGAQSAISRLMENQINQRMLANVTTEYALRVVDKALEPDPRDPIKPRRVLIVICGFVLGLTIGLFLVWIVPERPYVSRARD